MLPRMLCCLLCINIASVALSRFFPGFPRRSGEICKQNEVEEEMENEAKGIIMYYRVQDRLQLATVSPDNYG